MIVADSDVLIDGLRGREPTTALLAREIADGRLATTVVNAFELLSGARSETERRKVAKLLDALVLLPLDQPAAQRAAAIRRELEAGGKSIGMADYLVAGICLTRSAGLWTRNRSHYDRIAGLVLAHGQ